jgi:hypothetical protein
MLEGVTIPSVGKQVEHQWQEAVLTAYRNLGQVTPCSAEKGILPTTLNAEVLVVLGFGCSASNGTSTTQ